MKPSLRVLHLEDSARDAELINAMLAGEGYECTITRIDNRHDFLKALEEGTFEIILCDYNLPSFDGNSALEFARKKNPDVPFIFVSGTIGEDRAIDALKKGATDYVLKNRMERLVPAVNRALREVEERRIRKHLEEELLQAQKMESLGQLASGIAHDFNNVLGIIMGHASLIEKVKSDPLKQSESVNTIVKASQRGALLVRQLLTFARKSEIVLESISINDLIHETIKLLSNTLPKSISITSALQENLPAIVADSSELNQVLLNLCVNARDAMPKGGSLTVKTSLVKRESVRKKFAKSTVENYIAIEVADTGTGMSEETRRRIFEPFFTTKEPGKGTGLGLSVAFGIISRHDGFIDVETETGRGTTFSIYLPVKTATIGQPSQKREVAAPVAGGTETLLVVEDEEMLRELVKVLLAGKGYTVLTAADGAEAVDLYRKRFSEVALVVCDLDLPKVNGYEVLLRMKKHNPSVKFILASGYISADQTSEVLKAGARDVVMKPYSPDEIVRKVRTVLDTR